MPETKETGAGRPAGAAGCQPGARPRISFAEFRCLVHRAGLPLTAAQMSEMYEAFAVVEAMAERVHAKNLETEPAVTFRPDPDGPR